MAQPDDDKIRVHVTVRYEGSREVLMTRAQLDEATKAMDKPGGVDPDNFPWFDFSSWSNSLEGEITDLCELKDPPPKEKKGAAR